MSSCDSTTALSLFFRLRLKHFDNDLLLFDQEGPDDSIFHGARRQAAPICTGDSLRALRHRHALLGSGRLDAEQLAFRVTAFRDRTDLFHAKINQAAT